MRPCNHTLLFKRFSITPHYEGVEVTAYTTESKPHFFSLIKLNFIVDHAHTYSFELMQERRMKSLSHTVQLLATIRAPKYTKLTWNLTSEIKLLLVTKWAITSLILV